MLQISIFSVFSRTLALPLCLVFISGCSTTGNWGSQATFRPGWQRVKQAAINAAKDPKTWIPLVSAAVFGTRDYDQKTVDWATKNTPVFGSVEDAKDASDDLDSLSTVNYVATVFATPSGSGTSAAWNKTRGLSFGLVAMGVNRHVTGRIKEATDRERPDGRGNNSFPSGHTSSATIAAALASRNIDHMNISENQKRTWQISSYTIAGLTGWARIEGNKHHPSDVLAGFALGNFLGRFLNDAFIAPDDQDKLELGVGIGPDGDAVFVFQYRW